MNYMFGAFKSGTDSTNHDQNGGICKALGWSLIT